MTSEVEPGLKRLPLNKDILPYIMIDERTGSFTIHPDVIMQLMTPEDLLYLIHESLFGALKNAYVTPTLPINKLAIIFNIISRHTSEIDEHCAYAYAKHLEALRDFFKSTVDNFDKTMEIISKRHGFVKDWEGKLIPALYPGTDKAAESLFSNVEILWKRDEHKEESDEND